MMEDLDKLIESVEAGADLKWHDFIPALRLDPHNRVRSAILAYHGSLDAARALHEALLPAYRFRIEDCHVSVWYGHSGPFLALSEAYKSPARAWLIAILKAHRHNLANGATQ